MGFRCVPTAEPETDVEVAREAIVGGMTDSTRLYAASFYLRSEWGVMPPTACSAVLITPRTLLTAAHCVDIRKVSGATSVSVFATNVSPRPNSTDAAWVPVSAISIHPQYNPTDFRDPFDIALVLLPAAPTGLTPIAYNARDISSGYVGRPITVVGWGLTSEGGSDQGTRRFVELTFRSVTANEILLGDMAGKGICNGDSGGPSLHTFADGVQRVVGLHSYTEPGAACKNGGDVRVDRFASFISQYVMANEGPTCVEDGLCKSGCSPVDVDCACRADGQCSAECPNLLSDPDCPIDCVGNGVCATDDCPVKDPDCVGELEACTSPSMCQRRTCATDPQRSQQYCTSPCGAGVSCPAGTTCFDGACLKPQQMRADAGSDCEPGVTLCASGTVCTGATDAGLSCVVPCVDESACGDTAHCVDGVGGQKFCQAPERRLPLLKAGGGDAAKIGCASVPGPALWWALLALRRRVRRSATR